MGLTCVAVPILNTSGYAEYAISISGPTTRINGVNKDNIKNDLMTICRELSEQLTYLG